MESKKKILPVCATVLSAVLLASMIGLRFASSTTPAGPTFQSPSIEGTPTPIPGNVYTGMYLRIGVNWGGTFGVGNGTDGLGVGFQYPIGNQFESLAIWWWGEGYAIFYKTQNPTGAWTDNKAYWWPSLGWPPPAFCRLIPVTYGQYMDDDNRAVVYSRMKTIDGALTLTFAFSFPKAQKYVLLQTIITNNLGSKVRDVLYKRIVDWDIHQQTMNYWTNDAHAAYASWFNANLTRWIVLSVAGYSNPTATLGDLLGYVDLSAWDDIDAWGNGTTTRDPGKADIQSHDRPLFIDANAAIYYDLWDLSAYETRNVWTVYQAGWNVQAPT
jgi:hypothetical protein